MQGNTGLKNGLNIAIDWMSFTLHDFEKLQDVIHFLGFSESDFVELPGGGYGYKSRVKVVGSNINILYDGADNMGIHVDTSGSGVPALLRAYNNKLMVDNPFGGKCLDLWQETVLSRLAKDVLEHGKFTRVDLAIDDFGACYYSMRSLYRKVEKAEYVSLWRRNKNLEEREELTIVGHTIYFGSTHSDIMLRVYDKQMETNKNRKESDSEWFPFPWVRWELQMRKSKACESMRLLRDSESLGNISIGILSHYLRLIKNDNPHKSRCSTDAKWSKFVKDVEPLRVHVSGEDKTIERKRKWISKSVAPSLALVFLEAGGDVAYLDDILEQGHRRLRPRDLRLLAKRKEMKKE